MKRTLAALALALAASSAGAHDLTLLYSGPDGTRITRACPAGVLVTEDARTFREWRALRAGRPHTAAGLVFSNEERLCLLREDRS